MDRLRTREAEAAAVSFMNSPALDTQQSTRFAMAADKSPLLRRRPFYQDVTDFVRATQTAAFSDRMEVSSGRPDMASPQAFTSSYATRLREYSNPLLASIFQPAAAQIVSTSRTTKRGTTSINYAEDEHEDDDIEYGDGLRRPTGLRSVRRQSFGPDRAYNQDKQRERPDKPVETLGIWRDWIGKSKLGRRVECMPAVVLLRISICESC